MTRKPLIVAALALAVACGKGGGGTGSTSPSITGSAGVTNSPRVTIGRVVAVGSRLGTLNGDEAFKGDNIAARDQIGTDGTGSLDFSIGPKLKRCQLYENSAVRAEGSPDAVIRYVSGTTWCATTRDPREIKWVTATDAEIRASDPIFGVTVTRDATVVTVYEGMVEVRSLSGGTGARILVGPMQQCRIPKGRDPEDPTQFSPDVRASITAERLGAGRGATPPRPAAGDSPTLQRLEEDQTFSIRFDSDDDRSEDAGQRFASIYFRRQASDWKLEPDFSFADIDNSDLEDLRGGVIDLIVAPVQPDGFATLPVVVDLNGTKWWMIYPETDDRFGDALRSYLRAVIELGQYDTLYRDVFDGQQPDYRHFESIMGF